MGPIILFALWMKAIWGLNSVGGMITDILQDVAGVAEW